MKFQAGLNISSESAFLSRFGRLGIFSQQFLSRTFEQCQGVVFIINDFCAGPVSRSVDGHRRRKTRFAKTVIEESGEQNKRGDSGDLVARCPAHPPKDPSVLKMLRHSSPCYFATAVVFYYPYRFPTPFPGKTSISGNSPQCFATAVPNFLPTPSLLSVVSLVCRRVPWAPPCTKLPSVQSRLFTVPFHAPLLDFAHLLSLGRAKGGAKRTEKQNLARMAPWKPFFLTLQNWFLRSPEGNSGDF